MAVCGPEEDQTGSGCTARPAQGIPCQAQAVPHLSMYSHCSRVIPRYGLGLNSELFNVHFQTLPDRMFCAKKMLYLHVAPIKVVC